MRTSSFHVGLVNAAAGGMKRAKALLPKSKKFNYGSAAILAMLVTPFAMQAVSATFAANGESNPDAPEVHVEQPAPQVHGQAQEKAHASGETTGNSSSSDRSNEVEVNVNGQNIQVPKNGSVHKEMKDSNSETTVHVDNRSSSNGSSYNSTTITVNGHSYSTDDEEQDERGSDRSRMR